MTATLLKLLPVVLGISIGVLLRRLRAAGERDGDFVLRLVFFVCLPALMFLSLARIEVGPELAVFPLAALLAVCTGHVAGRLVARRPGWEPPQRGVLLTAGMTVNGSFPLPFVQALHGTDGVARLAAFDGLNTILTFSWAYYTAARANPLHDGGSILLDRVAKSPPLYGVAAGLAVNAAGWEVPAAVGDPIALFAGATGPLLSIGIGIMLRPPGVELRKAAAIVAVRLGTGLAVAVGVVLAFGLTGVDRAVLLLLGVSPVAFVTVAFASLENLDTKLATSTLSLAMAASLVLSSGIVLLAA